MQNHNKVEESGDSSALMKHIPMRE